AIEFRVTGRELQHDDGETQEREVVADVQPSNVTLSELLTRPRSAALGEGSKAEQASAIMREQLVDGEWHPSSEVRDVLYTQGLNHNQIVHDARRLANVNGRKQMG